MKPSFEIISVTDDAISLLERAYRTCYQSEPKGHPEEFLTAKIKMGHLSPLEHASMTVVFVCDRGVSHELVRHRLMSPSQESTRYCIYLKGVKFIDIREGIDLDPKMVAKLSHKGIEDIVAEWTAAMEDAERHYTNMLGFGATPQIARSVLPNSTKTQIVVTANFREWRHIFELRTSSAAHPQMRQLMSPLLEKSKKMFPCIFGDIR